MYICIYIYIYIYSPTGLLEERRGLQGEAGRVPRVRVREPRILKLRARTPRTKQAPV